MRDSSHSTASTRSPPWSRPAAVRRPCRRAPRSGSSVPRASPKCCAPGAESFVRALHNALRADVDPASGRHLAVHHQALAIELVEMSPRLPSAARDSSSRSARAAHPRGCGKRRRVFRTARERFVVLEAAQDLDESCRKLPSCARLYLFRRRRRACRGPLGNFRVEVVLQHAKRRFGQPAAATQHLAAWCANDAGPAAMERVLHSWAAQDTAPAATAHSPSQAYL